MAQDASDGGSQIAVEVIDTMEALEKIRGPYRAVHRADPDADVFLSWEWLARVFADHAGAWRIYAVRDARVRGGYAGFLPVQCFVRWSVSRKKFQTTLTDAGRLGQGQSVGFVCVPSLEDQVLEALGQHLNVSPWARLSLRYEPSLRRAFRFSESFVGEDFAVDFPKHETKDGSVDLLPDAVLTLPDDYADFYGSLGGKMRKYLRRAVEDIKNLEGVRYTITNSRSFAEDREALLDLWSIPLEETVSEKRQDQMIDAQRKVLNQVKSAGLLYQVSLWQGERVLCSAAHIVDRKQRSIRLLLEGQDEENDPWSTDLLLNIFAIQKAIEAGCTAYHFGHGAKDNAYRLGAEPKQTAYLAISRRSASEVGALDPAMVGQALKRAEKFVKKGDTENALAALKQIRSAWRS